MEFLGTNATASPLGVYVLCRYLSGSANGHSEEELRQSLQVLRASATRSEDPAAVFTDSLAVAKGLDLVRRDAQTGQWMVDREVGESLGAKGDTWPWFRGCLLHRIAQSGIAQLDADGSLPDLVLAFAWLQQLDPLNPLPLTWGEGPEGMLRALNLAAVANATQWRHFQRWVLAVGLARRAEVGDAKVLVADASTAIADQLWSLPRKAPADKWLDDLRNRLPFLGSPKILQQLPAGKSWDELPAGVALGLLKLEKASRLTLEPSDDASHVIALGLGPNPRQVGRILVRSES